MESTLAGKFAQFSDHWGPRIVAEDNGNDIMVVKVLGDSPGTLTQTTMTSSSS